VNLTRSGERDAPHEGCEPPRLVVQARLGVGAPVGVSDESGPLGRLLRVASGTGRPIMIAGPVSGEAGLAGRDRRPWGAVVEAGEVTVAGCLSRARPPVPSGWAVPSAQVTVCAECGSVLIDGVGHDELCSRTGDLAWPPPSVFAFGDQREEVGRTELAVRRVRPTPRLENETFSAVRHSAAVTRTPGHRPPPRRGDNETIR